MSASRLYTNYAITVHRLTQEAGGAAFIDGVQSIELASGLQTQLETGDGRVAPTFGSLVSGEPRGRFTTNDVKGMLDIVSSFGDIDSDGTHPGVSFFAQQMVDGGSRQTTVAHEAVFGEGLIVARTVEATHRGAATASGEVIGRSSDGAISPVALDEAATLDAAAAQVAAIWTVGKVDLNGTQWEGIESISIDLGVQEVVETKDSDIYPTFVTVREQRPTITIRGSHIEITSFLTEDGLYIASGVIVYLRKRVEGGSFVPDITAEHISFTLGKCRVEWRTISADPKMLEMVLTPWDTEAGTAQIAIDTATAIV